MSITIPSILEAHVKQTAAGKTWLAALPDLVAQLSEKWRLKLEAPFDEDLTGSWVAPCEAPAGPAVLKIGFPHFEAEHEIDGLIAWGGRCAVRLYAHQRAHHALLLERCLPGETQEESAFRKR